MNKRTIAVVAGMILLQSAAFAADTKDAKVKESTSVVGKTKKKGFFGKISSAFKSEKETTKSVASHEVTTVGAY